ncbi:MAG: translation initiation factor 1 [Gammaproteobacteria bacterium]|jgi:translation initiation factor 1
MNRVVYSTDSGRQCPDCKHPKNKCICKQKKQQRAAPSDGIVRLQLQTKGRKGKGVTLITGLPLSQTELKQLAKDLKQRCSTGGSIKDDIIEIQGDQRKVLERILLDRGYTVKISGG